MPKRNTDHRSGYRVTFTDGGHAFYAFAPNMKHARAQAERRYPNRTVAKVTR